MVSIFRGSGHFGERIKDFVNFSPRIFLFCIYPIFCFPFSFLFCNTRLDPRGETIKEIDFSKEIPREIPATNRHFCPTQKAKFYVFLSTGLPSIFFHLTTLRNEKAQNT